MNKSQLDTKEKQYRELLSKDPENVDVLVGLGDTLTEKGDLDEAEIIYRKAQQIEPGYARIAFSLGNLLINKNDTKAAAEAFLEGFKINPYCTLLLKAYYGVTKSGFYIPSIIVAAPVKELTIEKYRAVIITDIRHSGNIGYDYVMLLYDGDNPLPIYYVSLENNNLFAEMGGTKNFLCAFDESGHANFGGFEQESTVDNFEKKAIELVKEKYHL